MDKCHIKLIREESDKYELLLEICQDCQWNSSFAFHSLTTQLTYHAGDERNTGITP